LKIAVIEAGVQGFSNIPVGIVEEKVGDCRSDWFGKGHERGGLVAIDIVIIVIIVNPIAMEIGGYACTLLQSIDASLLFGLTEEVEVFDVTT
jgi:hypothetical protein